MVRTKAAGMLARWRKLLLVVGTTAYVAAAAVRAAEGRGVRTWFFVFVALVVAYVASRRKSAATTGTTWGIALVLASLAPARDSHWVEALGALGALVAAAPARWALAHVVAVPSLARSRPTRPHLGVALLGVAWLGAFAAHVTAAVRPHSAWGARAPLVAGAAAVVTAALFIVGGLSVASRRRLELGIVARTAAVMGLTATIALLAAAVGLLRVEDGDRVGRLAVAGTSAIIVWIALHADGVVVARVSRRLLVLAFVGGAVAMFGAGAAGGRGGELATLLTAAVALAIGALVRHLETPLRPFRGEWLDAIEKARSVLLEHDPDDAVREALVALHAPVGPTGASPELYSFAPLRVATIDTAGYLHERDAVLPDRLLEVTAQEPEATLRIEVLEALEVRRPDLRPLAAWMLAHGAFTATVVTRGGDPEGLLVMPAGGRTELLSLEEARSLKRLADALAGVCHERGRHARALARELELAQRAEHAEEEVETLSHAQSVEAGRHALATWRLARPATVGVYSAASRMALDAIERRAHAGVPIVLVAPSGIDPVPYLARAHLEGPRRDAPFAVVDATMAREHDLARWNDPAASPLGLADGGTLVLVDGAALPTDVQRLVARALAEKRVPWERAEPLDVALAITSAVAPGALVDAGRLDPMLASRLGDALTSPIVLPRLRDRPEDLRAIMTDRLAREGLRVRGAAVGIDAGAFARLIEYTFPGEDAELAAIVQRLVALAPGDVVRADDVDAVLRERAAALGEVSAEARPKSRAV